MKKLLAFMCFALSMSVMAEPAFKIIYPEPQNAMEIKVQNLLKQSPVFKGIEGELNALFQWPVSVNLLFSPDDPPMYVFDDHTIHIGTLFFADLAEAYMGRYPDVSDEEVDNFIRNSITASFFHELGHALSHVYQLPIPSDEETAVDNLSAIIALEYLDNGLDVVLSRAQYFDLLDSFTQKNLRTLSYWDKAAAIELQKKLYADEHAMEPQRFYNVLCLAYGKAPAEVNKLVDESGNNDLKQFLVEKKEYCNAQYQLQLKAWFILLKPHFKPQGA